MAYYHGWYTGTMLRTENTPLGRLLHRHREARGWSQSELARRLGINHSHISRIESGSRKPRHDMLDRITDALDLTPQEIADMYVAAYIPEWLWPELAGVTAEERRVA